MKGQLLSQSLTNSRMISLISMNSSKIDDLIEKLNECRSKKDRKEKKNPKIRQTSSVVKNLNKKEKESKNLKRKLIKKKGYLIKNKRFF